MDIQTTLTLLSELSHGSRSCALPVLLKVAYAEPRRQHRSGRGPCRMLCLHPAQCSNHTADICCRSNASLTPPGLEDRAKLSLKSGSGFVEKFRRQATTGSFTMQRAGTADSLPNFSAASISERQEMVRTLCMHGVRGRMAFRRQ